MRKILSFLFFLISLQFVLNAQLNDYKYVVVPVKFAAFKNPNQFQTSTLIKHFMTQEGFNVIYDNALPIEVLQDRCLALFTDLLDESGLFSTKIVIVLKDCKGKVIFKTAEAQTKIKELDKAYKTVLKESCASFQGIEHNYKQKKINKSEEVITVSFKDDVKNIESTSEKKLISEEGVSDMVDSVMQQSTRAEENSLEVKKGLKYLYAKPLENGFKLIDANGGIKYILEETSIESVFLVNQEGVNGVILKKDDKWYLEYKGDTGKIIEQLFIKF